LNQGLHLQKKILTNSELHQKLQQWKSENKTVVFTNGCFDILHAGHIASLTEASQQGDVLIVGLNADDSVRNLKGPGRPMNNQDSRALLLAALVMVDAVIIFPEPTPKELILSIKPDILVKGGDYKPEEIAGAKEVMAYGGRVVINKIVPGFSTTSIIDKIQKSSAPGKEL
jgi:D-glycero-beta-D-manno-heptose 1-phosphate adenylyltransferase